MLELLLPLVVAVRIAAVVPLRLLLMIALIGHAVLAPAVRTVVKLLFFPLPSSWWRGGEEDERSLFFNGKSKRARRRARRSADVFSVTSKIVTHAVGRARDWTQFVGRAVGESVATL